MTTLDLPPGALVLLIGPAGSGKTTLAARHFTPVEVLSSDDFRAAVSGDPADQSVTGEAFRRLHAALTRRLAARELTVIDATNVQTRARRSLLAVAALHERPAVAVVLALPLDVSLARNAGRVGRTVPAAVVRKQDRDLRSSLPLLAEEGYATVLVLTDPDQVERLDVRRKPDTKIRTYRNVPKERHPAH